MKFLVLTFLTFLLGFTSAKLPGCRKICARCEIGSCSKDFIDTFNRAVMKLQNIPSKEFPGLSRFDEFVQIHETNSGEIHGCSTFAYWHRYITYRFEQALQDVEPGACVPYWYSGLDRCNIPSSPFFTLFAAGPNGPYSNYKSSYGACRNQLVRSFNPTTNKDCFVDVDTISATIRSVSNYKDFSATMEVTYHPVPHTVIGGHMSTMHSPCDPAFYLHHAFCDKTLFNFQTLHDPQFQAVNGQQYNGRPLTADTPLPAFPNVVIGDVIDPANMCYYYVNPTAVTSNGKSRAPNSQNTSLNNTVTNSTRSINGTNTNSSTSATPTDQSVPPLDPNFAKMNNWNTTQLTKVLNNANKIADEVVRKKENGVSIPLIDVINGQSVDSLEAKRVKQMAQLSSPNKTQSSVYASGSMGGLTVSTLSAIMLLALSEIFGNSF
jgi:hypothetical protein